MGKQFSRKSSFVATIIQGREVFKGEKYSREELLIDRSYWTFKVNLEFSFSFPGFSFSGLDLVFKSGFQT